MVRQGNFKLIHNCGHPPLLFDLSRDPEETNNRANDPACATVLKSLQQALAQIGDPAQSDARAKADQGARIAHHGGQSAIISGGSWGHTPPPVISA
jgi:choline-sulfatase